MVAWTVVAKGPLTSSSTRQDGPFANRSLKDPSLRSEGHVSTITQVEGRAPRLCRDASARSTLTPLSNRPHMPQATTANYLTRYGDLSVAVACVRALLWPQQLPNLVEFFWY